MYQKLLIKSWKKLCILLITVLFWTTSIAQETITVTGRVLEAQNRTPIGGASVTMKGSTSGSVTDDNGNFRLAVNRGATIVISFTGFAPQEFVINNTNPIQVELQPTNAALSEVIVIGYGERRRRDVTGAVSSVGSKDIEKSTALSPELAMQGRMAGVFVSTPSGEPNARPSVRIRGVNTFGYAEPLYVVDGVPVTEGGQGVTEGAVGDLRTPVNIFTMINPDDIESISVLKDASAAAVYGVRASNGVILITTKRGKTGKPKVSLNLSYGVQNIPKTISVLNTSQYVSLYKEAYGNYPNFDNGVEVPFGEVFGPEFDESSDKYLGNSPTYDWQRELQNRNAPIQDHSVSLQGGTEAVNYYLSLGYGKTESPLKANNMERYSVSTNLNAKISRFIETGFTLRLAQNRSLDNTQADLQSMATAPPWQPLYDDDDKTGYAAVAEGKFVTNPDYDPSLLNPGPRYIYESGYPTLLWGRATRFNPLAFQALNENKFNLWRVLGSAYVQIEPIKGLKIRGNLGGDIYWNQRQSWGQYDAYRFSQTPGNPYEGHDGTAVGSYSERHTKNTNLLKELTAKYNRTFGGRHNVELTATASDQEWRWDVLDVSSSQVNYLDPDLRNVNNVRPFVGGFTGKLSHYVLQGYMGRLSYNYDNRYYLDVTVRRDASSRFAKDYRWGTFPSFAAAWRVSDEKFMQGINWISDLKIRGGWGQLGNEQTTGGFAYLSQVNMTPDYPIGSGNGDPFGTQVQGSRLPNFANKTLSWETLETTNIGFDAVFIDKVNFTFEYYRKFNRDIIQSVPLPPNTGIEFVADLNIATVRNTGVEFEVGYNDRFGQVGFNASANFTTVKNRVVDLFQDQPTTAAGGRVEEGYPIGYLFGYQLGGIFQTQAEIDAWKERNTDINIGAYEYQPGDAYFVDLFGNPTQPKELRGPRPDSVINSYDRTYLGKTIPGFYYGFNLGANYMGFDLSVFFQGVGDVQKYNNFRAAGENMSSTGANQWSSVQGRWTSTNPSSTMPRAMYGDPAQFNRYSSRFVENAGFIRLKNLQLGYSVPKQALQRLGFIEGFRIYFSGINLFTITDWTGIDPENDLIPPTRQFLFGINANF